MLRLLMPISHAISVSGCVPYPIEQTPHLHGVVIDARTQQPLADAVLSFDDFHTISATTTADGTYDFPSITRWQMVAPYFDRHIPDRVLVVEAPGFRPLSVKIASYQHGERIFALEPQ
jgi:hypothetical protein